GSVAYTVIPIVTILVFWVYLFFRIYRSLKNSSLKKGWQIAIPLTVGGAITLPIAGLWTAIDAYSVTVIYFCVFLLLTDFITFIIRLLCKRDNKIWQIIRNFMLIPLLCTVIVFTYGIINVGNIVRTEYDISTYKNIRAEGYKIALLSDVHYGKLNNKNDLERLAESLSEQELDIVIICGDIVDEDTTKAQVHEIFSILGTIKSSYGSYFIFGNHDKQPYNKKPVFTEAELVSVIERNGINILNDESVNIGDDILLVGRRDRKDERKSVEELLIGADSSKYIIFADHEPYDFKIKSGAGVDLQLSGHTHAGQLFPVGTVMNLFNIGDMVYGKKQVGNMIAITTSGITGSHPLRTQGRSEYVVITIYSK
ncbi:MAG: metallophosphoesterase family protein, partial [Clostridiales bacterium]|nr:metallophosphoesterase family protein [Clostridiales bacterium]